ncbi:hypothetical protein PUMCH_004744 [Australozyma saopauloensis]|uniref:Thioredoxin domain-containing protein n=1 Tax=Australozyma saopauloensis TaxID=291208 RepID=A0AAX4HG46_9ASCO|nr:hypothetical protein PUMCH_004744 [[Candida] saopauloensis]
MKTPFLLLAAAVAVAGEGFYSSNKNIYELNPASFKDVVYNSNYTSVVEFYAPWCGYCKQIKPVFSKLGKFLHGESKYAVNVAAVNCDEEINKLLCARHKVQGFPTIMVFRPPKHSPGKKRAAKHVPEVFNGVRELAPMAEYVSSRIKNYVKKIFSVHSELFASWLDSSEGPHKVVILTKSSMVSPLLRTLAIDFLDSVSFAAVNTDDLTGPTTITYNNEQVEIPIKENEKYPVVLVYDSEENKFHRYDGSVTKLPKVEKFIMAKTGAKPTEGRLSARGKKLAVYRGAAKVHDEL